MSASSLGLLHFFAQADWLARARLIAMLVASLASWVMIAERLTGHWRLARRGAAFLARYRRAHTLAEVADGPPADPWARLARLAQDASRHYRLHANIHVEAGGGLSEFLTRSLRQGIEEEAERLERGLTLLASIGSTAPFVGLFGTVWGIYHALVAIGLSGQGTLDKVAGPVGEALIMTALGLAVAIPAVLGYNALTRRNRILLGRLDAFGHDLLALALTGAPLAYGLRDGTSVQAEGA